MSDINLNESYWTCEENKQVEQKKHFPTLIKNFIKKIFKGLFKQLLIIHSLWGRVWGSGILIIIILILYFTNSFTLFYYNVQIKFEMYRIESTIKRINKYKQYLLESSDNLGCYKKQFERLGNGEKVEIWYCK